MVTTSITNAEEKAQNAINVGASYCKGLKLQEVKDLVERILKLIGSNGMFDEYTMHDITHVNGVLMLLDKIIPQETASVMTNADWLMIVLAVYFHDVGMFISKTEYEERTRNEDFMEFKREKEATEDIRKYLMGLEDEKRDRFLYQEFVRKNHGHRIYEWINNCESKKGEPYELIYDVLKPLNTHFRRALAEICQSHQQNELPASLQIVDASFGPAAQDKVNLLYIAVLLRTADLLHVTCDRTPTVEYRLISPQNKVSKREWLKQQAVLSIDIKSERNDKGEILDNQTPHVFEFQAEFSDPECYFSFVDFVQYSIAELKRCYSWCEISAKQNKNSYYFPWDDIDIDRVRTTGFSKDKLHFDIDHDNILSLLTGHTLYNDSTVVLRELIQNAIDAEKAHAASEKEGTTYRGHIEISWDSALRLLSISDNGTGMSVSDVKNYLLRVGASKYQSEAFKKAYPSFHSISRFGIGLLTCFMISDDVDIYTLSVRETHCLHLMIRKLNGEYLMRNDADPSVIYGGRHGTKITLKVRPDVNLSNLEAQIKQWIVLPYGEVILKIDNGEPISIGYKDTEDVIQTCCASLENIKIDGKDFKIDTIQAPEIGLNMSCLKRRDPYTGVWSIWYQSNRERSKLSGGGVCIDGIRVTQDVPGADGDNSLIIVNCEGNLAPKTNVARNDIEAGEALEKLYQVLYSKYLQMYVEQAQVLQQGNSSIWAFKEINFYLDIFCDRLRQASLYKKDILQKALCDIRCCVFDDGTQISIKSLVEFPEMLYTIDSVSYSASVSLLQDIKNSVKTPIALLKELACEQFNGISVLSEKSLSSNLINLFYQTYEPDSIIVNQALRSIKICWKKGHNRWHIIGSDSHSYRFHFFKDMAVFVIKNGADAQLLQGADEYKIICSYNRLFLFPDTPIYKYVVEHVLVNGTDQRKVEFLFAMMIEVIWNKSFESSEINRYFETEEIDIGVNSRIIVQKTDFVKALNDSLEYILNFKYYYHM